MNARTGILAAILSSTLGGMNTAVTRFATGATDPVTLAALRFGPGFVFLLPLTLALRARWPQGKDRVGVAALGILFFAIFMSTFNLSLRYTTAARGALALSTLPLLTMIVGALLRVEPLTMRKAAGVLVAIGGVAIALIAGLSEAPAGAWRGDLIMLAGSLCMALYNVWSRPFIARSSPLTFVTAGMGSGSACLLVLAWTNGGLSASSGFGLSQWIAVLYLGAFGAALTFFLWVFALERTTPTRVASTITLNPVTASLLAAPLVGEPIGANLLVGVIGVGTGIWIASTDQPVRRRDSGSGSSAGETGAKETPDRWHSDMRDLPSAVRIWRPHPPPRIAAWQERARSRRLLARLDDRTLRDIGTDRTVIEDESTTSFWRRR